MVPCGRSDDHDSRLQGTRDDAELSTLQTVVRRNVVDAKQWKNWTVGEDIARQILSFMANGFATGSNVYIDGGALVI
jgi:hypothetical protein